MSLREDHSMLQPVDLRAVANEPGDSKDDVVTSDVDDIQGESF